MAPRPALEPDVLRDLVDVVGPRHVLTAPADVASHAVDWTGRFQGTTPAVVQPATAAEVAGIIELCRRHDLRTVPQGGNTGLVGGSVPMAGEVVVSLRRMTEVDQVDQAAAQVTVGAGATVGAVQAAAAAAGLRYAVDFTARDSATIGGTIATNAGGINLLRFGGTREQLLGVEAVLGTGDSISHLGGLVKDNTGYDLASLLCGSEGTLGIITAARLRLVPSTSERVTALVGFPTVRSAVDAVRAWRGRLPGLEAAELLLDGGLRLVCESFDLPPPLERAWEAYVLIEAAVGGGETDMVAEIVGGTAGAGDAAVATDPARRAALWRYREDHTLAVNRLGPPHKLDVTLPASELAHFVAEVPAVVAAAAPEAITWLFGHAGDGNIHVNVTGLAPEDDRVEAAVLPYVASMGGSISAEHGIGTAKKRWLHLNRSDAEIRTMRAVKRALDPDGVLNPNVLLPATAP